MALLEAGPEEFENPFVGVVSTAMGKRLVDAGFHSYEKISRSKLDELTEINGIGEKTAIEILSYAQEYTGTGATKNGWELLNDFRNNAEYMSTSANAESDLNDLIGGGFMFTMTYMLYGSEGNGKSQILCQAIANCITPKEFGGHGRKALIIDVENITAQALGRVEQMILYKGANPEECFKNRLDVAICSNSDMQITATQRALDSNNDYGLLAMDGIMTKFSQEYIGRGTLADRQGRLLQHMKTLEDFGVIKNAVVIFTAQVHDKPDAMFADAIAYKGGHVLGHNAKYIIKLAKSKSETFMATLKKSPNLPVRKAIYRIEAEGIFNEK